MFMKIFTVLIISFNNIFTFPQNINNDEITTQSLIRNKREGEETYELNLKKGFVYLIKNINGESDWSDKDEKWDLYIHITVTNKHTKLN